MVDILMDPESIGFRRTEPRYGGYSRNINGNPWDNFIGGLIGHRDFLACLSKEELYKISFIVCEFEHSEEYEKLLEDDIEEFGESGRYW